MGEGYSRASFGGSLAEAAAALCWESGDMHRSGESLEFIAPASVAVIILHRRRRGEGTHIVDVIRIKHMDRLYAAIIILVWVAGKLIVQDKSWEANGPGMSTPQGMT